MTENNARTKLLQQLVRDAHYVVDPQAVAHAIILRSMTQRVVPDVTFRSKGSGHPSSLVSAPSRSAVVSAEHP